MSQKKEPWTEWWHDTAKNGVGVVLLLQKKWITREEILESLEPVIGSHAGQHPRRECMSNKVSYYKT